MKGALVESPAALDAALTEARTVWPGLAVVPDEFAAHVRGLGIDVATLHRRGAEVCLAFACARGDGVALAAFERSLLAGARRQIGGMGIQGELADEILQIVRVRLLVGAGSRIATYRGEGSLESWVRVAAAHVALNELRARNIREKNVLTAAAEPFVRAADPELAVTKDRLRQPLSDALEAALAALTDREKTLLRLHVLDDLGIDEIGAMYRVHRATAARWLVKIREEILGKIRDHLGLPARPTTSDFRSLVALLRDELHVSVKRALGG